VYKQALNFIDKGNPGRFNEVEADVFPDFSTVESTRKSFVEIYRNE